MSKLEEIKEYWAEGKVQEWDAMPEHVQYLLSIIEQSQGDGSNDAFWKLYDRFEDKIADNLKKNDQILSLQSKLEQAEKALESVANSGARETMRRYAEEALKAIRREE